MAFALTDKQCEAFQTFQSPTRPIVWPGSIRSGKTVGGIFTFMARAFSHPGPYIISSKSIGSAKRNVIRPMQYMARDMGVPFKWLLTDHEIHLGDSIFYVFGGKDEASQDLVQGLTARGYFGDEAALQPKSFVMQCIARCSLPDPLILLTLNKTSPAHWIKRELIDEGLVDVIESRIEDNPHISDDTYKLYDTFFSGHYHARMVENLWAGAEGVIYPPLLEGIAPETSAQTVISVDGALSGTTAALRFEKGGGHWTITDEYYSTGEKPQELHAAEIKSLAPQATVVIDPSASYLIKPLRDIGMFVVPANNAVEFGIQVTRHAILQGKVRLRHAPNFEIERNAYIWDEKFAERGESKPVKTRDHACDCLRYFCVQYCKPNAQIFKKPDFL